VQDHAAKAHLRRRGVSGSGRGARAAASPAQPPAAHLSGPQGRHALAHGLPGLALEAGQLGLGQPRGDCSGRRSGRGRGGRAAPRLLPAAAAARSTRAAPCMPGGTSHHRTRCRPRPAAWPREPSPHRVVAFCRAASLSSSR
jgi:hypothetical protein